MAETGFIDSPFTVVKSYRLRERQNRATVVPVTIGIETFYKVYRKSRLKQSHQKNKIYSGIRPFSVRLD